MPAARRCIESRRKKQIEETRVEMELHRKAGYRQFQIKGGNDAVTDVECIRPTMSILEPGENAAKLARSPAHSHGSISR